MVQEQFTKYEIARIIGARALQIAMDAPLLLNVEEEKLKEINYDALRIAELEFKEGVLPITIHRPSPRRGADKLKSIKEDKVSDEELIEKEQELEKEIAEDAKTLGLINAADADDSTEDEEGSEEQ
jgi:DNA-directed RNA polymerase subunit K